MMYYRVGGGEGRSVGEGGGEGEEAGEAGRLATHLLHLGAAVGVDLLVGALAELLVLGVDVHGDLEELLVEEGDTGLESPRHRRLVGPKAVGRVEVLDALDELLVERLGVRGGVEVEVA
jgi:hypothetical protein